MDFQQPTMEAAELLVPRPNLGATLDVITGRYLIGRRGEAILAGGASPTIGIVGMPNAFKSAFIHYVALCILWCFDNASGHSYDTESTLTQERITGLALMFPGLFDEGDLFEIGRWMITNRDKMTGELWFDTFKKFLQDRIKNRDKLLVETPFMDRDGKAFKMMPYYVGQIDSLSEFTTTSDMTMQDENKLGAKGGQTLFMRQGLNKTRLMQEVPALAVGANAVVLITAHLGKEIPLDPKMPPSKTLQYLNQGIKIKGAPPKFEYLTHITWAALKAPPLVTKDKTPLYPRDSSETNAVGDTDLVAVSMVVLRNKSGPSGQRTELVYSQAEGLLPHLTEFHYIKSNGEGVGYGIEGNDRNYALTLLPEIKLSRTTVRGKLDEDEKLQRACQITAELCQMHQHWHHIKEKLCTPAELYNDLKDAGYDWNLLLDTRGWWSSTEEGKKPFLSTVDLLRMRWRLKNPDHKWGYHPYWYPVPVDQLKATA